MSDRIYLDHAAGSPLRPAARATLEEALAADFGNPGSPHREGQRARAALERARGAVSDALGVPPRSVVFTGGGTEAARIALVGAAQARPGRALVCSALEHPAISDPAKMLAARGTDRRIAPVEAHGVVSEEGFLGLCERGGLAALIAVHHETGHAQPVPSVAKALEGLNVVLVCDAALAPGRIPLEPLLHAAPLVSFSAHKFGGPPGMGVLVVAPGSQLVSPASGGLQEERLRAGTQNVAGALATAAALREAVAEQPRRAQDHVEFAALVEQAIGEHGSVVGAHPPDTGILCIAFKEAEGEALMMNMDLAGVAIATGSTCALGGRDPSPGLLAMGYDVAKASRTVRISFGWNTNRDEVKSVCEHIHESLRGLGRLSTKQGNPSP